MRGVFAIVIIGTLFVVRGWWFPPPPPAAAAAAAAAAVVRKKGGKMTIRLSPGGYAGIYQLGVVDYLKQHYYLDSQELVFHGSSAGSWMALVLAMKDDVFLNVSSKLVDDTVEIFKKYPLVDIAVVLNAYINSRFAEEDFTISSVVVDMVVWEPRVRPRLQTHSISDFTSKEEVARACTASSHIPFITNPSFLHFFRGMTCFDGGFGPLLGLRNDGQDEQQHVVLHIHRNMWKQQQQQQHSWWAFWHLLNNLVKRNQDFRGIYEEGYRDTHDNHAKLDTIFLPKERALARFGKIKK